MVSCLFFLDLICLQWYNDVKIFNAFNGSKGGNFNAFSETAGGKNN